MKGLIDLSRANTPRNTVAEGAQADEKQPSLEPEAQPVPPPKIEKKTRAANTNAPKPVPATTPKTTVPAVQPAERQSTLGARIPESLHQAIRVFCIANRMEMQQFVQEALYKHLADLESETPK